MDLAGGWVFFPGLVVLTRNDFFVILTALPTQTLEEIMAKTKLRQYAKVPTPAPNSRVLILEVVLGSEVVILEDDDFYNGCNSVISLDELLEGLREYGAAEVVDHFYVSTGFDDTCHVLTSRVKDL